MTTQSDLEWHGDGLVDALSKLTQSGLDDFALIVLGQSVIQITVNGQVDTGFMRASGFVDSPTLSTFGSAKGSAQGIVSRPLLPSPGISSDDPQAIVAYGAEYAIWQELLHSFLVQALTDSASQIPSVMGR